jgi:tRNA(fMet)-specific endonuclease VapC
MNYLLDTSSIIDLLRKKGPIIHFISSHHSDAFLTSCICQMELAVGVFRERKDSIEKKRKEIEEIFSCFYSTVPFDSIQAQIAGEIKADLFKRGAMIDDLDILIAACAIASNAILVTPNIKHFTRVKNLHVISPS